MFFALSWFLLFCTVYAELRKFRSTFGISSVIITQPGLGHPPQRPVSHWRIVSSRSGTRSAADQQPAEGNRSYLDAGGSLDVDAIVGGYLVPGTVHVQ